MKGVVRRNRYFLMKRMRNWSYVNHFCFDDNFLNLKILFRSIRKLQKYRQILNETKYRLNK